MDDKDKQRFFNAIKHGSIWDSEKIVKNLKDLIESRAFPVGFGHTFSWDNADNFHYIYDNECYLFVEDYKIVLRSDRENVFSANQNIDFPIVESTDIYDAYRKFLSMTMEDEED